MAYLAEKTLHCPVCSFSDRIRLVVGVGPGSRTGDIPYRRYNRPAGFVEGLHADGRKNGTLLCPQDGTLVWSDQASQKAATT